MTQTIERAQSGEQGKTGRWAKAVERHEIPKGFNQSAQGCACRAIASERRREELVSQGSSAEVPLVLLLILLDFLVVSMRYRSDSVFGPRFSLFSPVQTGPCTQEAVTNFCNRFHQKFPDVV